MTAPAMPSGDIPALSVSAPTPTPPEPIEFPLGWLMDHASPPIQYRAITEVARLPALEVGGVGGRLGALRFGYRPPLTLAVTQRADGTWSNTMLTVPGARAELFQGVGTINAVRRLLEYGWDHETPPFVNARRILFRLLAEDEDPAFLFEFAPRGKPERATTHYGRTVLREAAAAVIAQAGYEKDPRLRGAARRIVERLDAFLRSPLAGKPFIRTGNQHVLAPEATPPSFHTLLMLSYMPLFRSENYDVMDRLFHYLQQPQPRAVAASLVAGKIVAQPHLVLGDPLPHRNAADADIPWALTWLELAARLGFLRRGEGWMRLFDRFLGDQVGRGPWHLGKQAGVLRSTNPLVWPSFPLEVNALGEDRYTDATFRLGLIGRLLGRPIRVV